MKGNYKMEKLYILGNGFDKAHSLPCDYWNFREYIEEIDYEFLIELEKLFGIKQIDESDPYISIEAIKKRNNSIYECLWKRFEENLGEMDDQEILDFSDAIVNDLDLETGPIGIIDTMNQYWEQQYGFITKLQEYLKKWIESIDISTVNPICNKLIDSNDYFFTFNYTDLLEKVYNIDPSNILHIHGGVTKNEGAPIIGHGNESKIQEYKLEAEKANNIFDEGRASIYEAIVNCYTRTLKSTKEYIFLNYHYFKKLSEVDTVSIIGHSYGNVDFPYFEKIKESVRK